MVSAAFFVCRDPTSGKEKLPFTDAGFIKEISYYTKAFAALEATDLAGYDFPELQTLIEQVYKIPVLNFLYPASSHFSQLYRVRRVEGFTQNPSLLSSYLAPPPALTRKGRANLVGFPVFYAALLPQTAVAECGIQEGKKFISAFGNKGRPRQ